MLLELFGCKLLEELVIGVWFLFVFVKGLGVFCLDEVMGNVKIGFGRLGECCFECFWFC